MDPLDDWDYELPDGRIAREPAPSRDASRLMVLDRAGGEPRHHVFSDLPSLLRPGDRVVVNDTRVMAARVYAKRRTKGRVQILFLEPGPGEVEVLLRPGRRIVPGEVLHTTGGGRVEVVARTADDTWRVRTDPDPATIMARDGHVPLPPYLRRDDVPDDRERYQTVFADVLGASAAPTAGLHFTPAVLAALAARGIGLARITLHVGLGTFRPLRAEDLSRGVLHAERYQVPGATADAIGATRAVGGRVVAVGTTTVRALEAATPEGGDRPRPGSGITDLFVRPGHAFRSIDGLVTNFHLPKSSLLVLVGALVGRDRLLASYATAVREGYRFYSYGDAMLVV